MRLSGIWGFTIQYESECINELKRVGEILQLVFVLEMLKRNAVV